jgi:hypothetical protein
VTVQTVPAVSGLSLTFENRRYVTDSGGRVLIPRAPGVSSTYVRSRTDVGSRKLDANTIVRFARWFTVGSESIAGLEVFRRIRWHFVDANGSPVPLRRIGSIVLRSSTGEVHRYRTRLGQPHWLLARRVASIRGQVKLKDVDYSVQASRSRNQRGHRAGSSRPSSITTCVSLAFFTLTVRGDALARRSARTCGPSCPTARRATRLVSKAVVASLPRGTGSRYRRRHRMPRPLVPSRSQVAVVPVV